MRLPDFIGVGPGRTGTTWMHRMLEGHVGLARGVKEVLFFNQYYAKGLGWYAHHFRRYPAAMPIGEISPGYFHSPVALERIAHDIPNCKIITTFREPVARLYSVYKLMRHYGWTAYGFEQAIADHEQKLEGNRYAHYLRVWQRTFGRERVLICLYDDFQADAQSYLDRVMDFIGAERIRIGKEQARERIWGFERAPLDHHRAERTWLFWRTLSRGGWYRTSNLLDRLGYWDRNAGGGERFPPLDPEIEAHLKEYYRPEVEEFEQLIGRDLSAWKRAPARIAAAANFR